MDKKKTVFIDCFDTIIFRREHPFSLLKRWAEAVNKLYPTCDAEEIYKVRKIASQKYSHMDEILSYVYHQLNIDVNERQFLDTTHMLEVEIEASVHYTTDRVKHLLSQYKKMGCKIYCVSDFHLPKTDLKYFFERLGVSELIDDIFVSSEYRATKAEGSLYDIVLSICGLEPSSVMMIGDNKISDIENAKKRGIEARWIPNIMKKKYMKLEKMKRSIPPERCLKRVVRDLRRSSDKYIEYVIIFWVFTVRLYKQLYQNGHKCVVFLSREGHFLKRCFDLYQEMCVPFDQRIESRYFKCSRRAITSVQEEKRNVDNFKTISIRNYFRAIGFNDAEIEKLDFAGENIDLKIENFPTSNQWKHIVNNQSIQESITGRITENERAFEKYVNEVFTVDTTAIVDIGWRGSMQRGIERYLHRPLAGYYLGINYHAGECAQLERHGLIFYIDSEMGVSQYAHILRSNTILYELLSAAPHGSAQNYRLDGEAVEVSEQWDQNEKELYEKYIKTVQQEMLVKFREFCVRDYENIEMDKMNAILAKLVLRTGLLPDKDRCSFMENLNSGFSQNFGQQTNGLRFDGAVKVSVRRLLYKPQEYANFLVKLPVKLRKSIRGGVLSSYAVDLCICESNRFKKIKLLYKAYG